MFAPHIERWRPIAISESHGVPSSMTLAYIWRESFGQVGAVGKKDSPSSYTDDEIAACGFPAALRRRDCGLMQITPATFRSYCYETGDQWDPCILLDKSERGATIQIRIGTWVLSRALFQALELSDLCKREIALGDKGWPHKVPTMEQSKMARLINGWGYGGTKARLAKLPPGKRSFYYLEEAGFKPARLFEGAHLIFNMYYFNGDEAQARAGWWPDHNPEYKPGREPLPWDFAAEKARGLARRKAMAPRFAAEAPSSSPAPASSPSSSSSGALLALAGAGLLALAAYGARRRPSSAS